MNEYTAYLPGEQSSLADVPRLIGLENDKAILLAGAQNVPCGVGDSIDGWRLVVLIEVDGKPAAVLEKHVTYRGVIAYVTPQRVVASIPKWVGDLASIRPRQVTAPPEVQLRRATRHVPGPDSPGDSILNSSEDPARGRALCRDCEGDARKYRAFFADHHREDESSDEGRADHTLHTVRYQP